MNKRKHDLLDEENPEWTESDFARARPAEDVVPPELAKRMGIRGPQKKPTKELISIRLSPDVVESFRSTGSGWQSRMDNALREWLEQHPPKRRA